MLGNTLNCSQCNKPFIRTHSKQKYCCKECYNEHEKKRKEIWRTNHKESGENKNNHSFFIKIGLCKKRHNNCFGCPYEDCIFDEELL